MGDRIDSPNPKEQRPGLLDAAARGLGNLLRSVRFKLDLRSVLNQIDPAHAPDLVKVALWTDPSIALAFLDSLPRAANALILAAAELADQSERLGPAILAGFLRENLGRVRLGLLGRTAGRITSLSLRLAAAQQDWAGLVREYTRGFAQGLPPGQWAEAIAGAAGLAERIVVDHPEWVDAAAAAVRRVLRDHPILVRRGLAPLLGPILEFVEQGIPTDSAR